MGIPKISDKTLALQSGRKTRSRHLIMIRAIYKAQGIEAATRYWLNECPRISKSAFQETIK